MNEEQQERFNVLKHHSIMTPDELLEAYIVTSDTLDTARETQTALEAKNADLRQRNEDAESLLLIARAERDTARETETAQAEEIVDLKAQLHKAEFMLRHLGAGMQAALNSAAEVEIARETEVALQEAVTAQDAEIKRLRAALEQIAHYAPVDDHITDYEMIVAGQQMILAGQLAKKALGDK